MGSKTIVITYDPDQKGHRLAGEDESGRLGDLFSYLVEEFNGKRIDARLTEMNDPIIVTVEGGVAQQVTNIPSGVAVEIHDYDVDGDANGDLHTVAKFEGPHT